MFNILVAGGHFKLCVGGLMLAADFMLNLVAGGHQICSTV
jgi:hypothetical protein